MRRTLALLAAVALAAAFTFPTVAAGPCVFMEAQGWWKGTTGIGANEPFGSHVHVGTCFPWGVPVSGTVELDVRILLHDNPGQLYRIRPQIWYDGGNVVLNEVYYRTTFPTGDGEVWQHISLDTTRVPFDGLQELRLFTEVRQPDGKVQYVSTGWALDIRNGKPVNHYKPDAQAPRFTEGRGWYTGANYTNSRFEDPAFQTPVSGLWTPDLKMTAGSGGVSVTSHAVYIDPDFHNGSSGITVKSGLGKWDGDVAIDTTTLTNGPHKLVLRADAAISTGTNSGLLVIPFVVEN